MASLAVYRISHLIAVEPGPFFIVSRVKGWIYEKADKAGQKAYGWHSLSDGVDCVLCISFWLSWLFAWILDGNYFVNSLAIAGIVLVVHKVLK